ncbi:hypothetical protein T07_5340 [Trichinella nelsoni]|uniref:Uncharacterized protein n=1 Tax=Trichinella nelsoni TaxID=6336 RepID=A0A0V0RD67_9BILA|nr:hypothetical protein T07_5340 [Trichinella nelsoni]
MPIQLACAEFILCNAFMLKSGHIPVSDDSKSHRHYKAYLKQNITIFN